MRSKDAAATTASLQTCTTASSANSYLASSSATAATATATATAAARMARRASILSEPSASVPMSSAAGVGDGDTKAPSTQTKSMEEAIKHLFCGGVAGSVAKTVTAPFSRLTILFQVHSMVTTKEHRPNFAMDFSSGIRKVVERGGIWSLWKGNATSVLHRFPFSAINFYVYESMLEWSSQRPGKLARFVAGATAGSVACVACYPLDLVRTRLTTELPGREHYRGITDSFTQIVRTEGLLGLYSGMIPTLVVAVPNFAISYTVYGSLKEYVLDDDLFYNLRKIDENGGEPKLGLRLTLFCGATSGAVSTLITYPADTVRRRMQIQNLHVPANERLSAWQQVTKLYSIEGIIGFYRGLTPELLKVVPMVGTMFFVYEFTKEQLDVKRNNMGGGR